MSGIDLEYARKSFQEYLSAYDAKDEKIKLKRVHTFCVVKAAEYITTREKISEEDRELALLIALLHDIGRFEQLKKYNSYDDNIMDHAKFGVQVLFEEGKIRDFIETDKYDEIIREAIYWHSAYQLPEMKDERILLHCKLIRDADKLDNFRVKATESLEAHFDVSKEIVETEEVSDNIMEAIREERSILRNERTTHLDMWVSYLAFIFDLNFASSFGYIQEHDYINHNIDRMNYTNPKTKERMKEVRKICLAYVEKRA